MTRLVRLANFVRAHPETKALVLRTASEVLRIRAILIARSFNAISTGTRFENPGSVTVSQIIRTVRTIAKIVPGATCLTQATAAHCLLHRYGYSSTIVVGARSESKKKFEAHAWLTYEGQVVLGGEELNRHRYSVLRSIDLAADK